MNESLAQTIADFKQYHYEFFHRILGNGLRLNAVLVANRSISFCRQKDLVIYKDRRSAAITFFMSIASLWHAFLHR